MQIQRSREELFLYPEILLFYRYNRILAARDLLGLQLSTHQRLDLRLMKYSGAKEIIRLMGRGMSKTFGLSVDSLIDAILYENLKTLVLASGGFRQGKLILEEIEKIIKCELNGQKQRYFALKMVDTGSRRTTGSVINKNPDMWSIKFKNGSIIATAPIGTKGDTIRGFRAHKTHIDERKDLKQEIKTRVINPFSIVDYAVITQDNEFENINIDSGTLDYEESDYVQQYYSYLRKIQEGDRRYLVIKFIYPDAFDVTEEGEEYKYESKIFKQKLKFWSIPYGIKVDDIEAKYFEDNADEEGWRAEHLCEPMRATGDFYPYNILRKASRKLVIPDEWYLRNPDHENIDSIMQYLSPKLSTEEPCVLGIDCAREDDYMAFSIIRVGQLSEKEWNPLTQEGKTDFSNVIWAYQERGMHDRDAAILIYKLLEKFPNILLVGMDKRGGGSHLRDQLYYVVEDGLVDGEVLYDPNDVGEKGIATLVKDRSGNDRLRLLSFSDKENTEVNRAIKNAMQNEKFFFAGGDERYPSKELEEVQKFIDLIVTQFKFIKTKPTKLWLNFYTEGKKKKDLFSATIYAYYMQMLVLYQAAISNKVVEVGNYSAVAKI